nr:hypothetical protein [uncultured Massilia sp.]
MGLSTWRPVFGAAGAFSGLAGGVEVVGQASLPALSKPKNFQTGLAGVVDVDVLARLAGLPEPIFFFARAALARASQVYNQKLVYRIVVVVNGAPHLWISQVFSTTSNVYVRRNPVGYRCVCLREKMNKNPGCAKNGRSPQSVPVDMQMLIHRPGARSMGPLLW